MYKTLILLIIMLGLSACTSSKYTYKEIKLGDNETILMSVPPKSKVPTKGNTEYSCSSLFRYQSVNIEGLSKSYYGSSDQINKARYRRGSESNVKGKDSETDSLYWGRIVYYPGKDDTSNVLIEVDYDKIFDCEEGIANRNYTDLINIYKRLPTDILINISEAETKYEWAPTISQNILEKVFELVPTPKVLSLHRYGYESNSDYYTLLLNPKFLLKVDTYTIVENQLDTKEADTFITYSNSNYVSFNRDDNSEIRQLPIINSSSSSLQTEGLLGSNTLGFPLPTLEVEVDYYSIGSSAGMQLSDKIRRANYISLYQTAFKNTAIIPIVNQSTLNKYFCEFFECSSSLVLESPESIFNPKNYVIITNKNEVALISSDSSNTVQLFDSVNNSMGISNKADLGINNRFPIYKTKAVFNDRSLISPEFYVRLNGNEKIVKFGTTLRLLLQTNFYAGELEIYRIYANQYRLVKYKNLLEIELLPGDKIEIK